MDNKKKDNNNKQQPSAGGNPNSTQNQLNFSEIRDNLLIMKDGSFRAVVECKSINFDLMSNAEREGVEYAYRNFINSLYFPVQILIRSKKVDIGPYLTKLMKIRSQQDNMLLNVLMDDYINYIDVLSQEANIMDKTFYIAVPYFPTGGDFSEIKEQTKQAVSRLKSSANANVVRVSSNVLTKAKEELQHRTDIVSNGLIQIGVHTNRLETKQLMQLYYNFYNPDSAINQPLIDFENVSYLYTSKGQGQSPRYNEG